VSQAAEETPVHLSPQSHIPVKELIQKLCHADSVSRDFKSLSIKNEPCLVQICKNHVQFRFASAHVQLINKFIKKK